MLWLKKRSQDLQAAGRSHIVHALVEMYANGQALQATGRSHIVHALIETLQGRAFQAASQSHIAPDRAEIGDVGTVDINLAVIIIWQHVSIATSLCV